MQRIKETCTVLGVVLMLAVGVALNRTGLHLNHTVRGQDAWEGASCGFSASL